MIFLRFYVIFSSKFDFYRPRVDYENGQSAVAFEVFTLRLQRHYRARPYNPYKKSAFFT